MGADLTDILGTDRAVNTRDEARRVIEAALDRYDGPCSQAYADVLSAYVAATDHGRANLFLEVAYRAVGVQPVPKPGASTDVAGLEAQISMLEAAPAPAFPLDAEQIVRLTGAVLAQTLSAVRHPDSPKFNGDFLTLSLGDAIGVSLPTETNRWGGRMLLDYGVTPQPKPASPEQPSGGSREG